MSWKITTLKINERNIKMSCFWMEVGRVVIHLSSSRQQSSGWGPSPSWGHTVSASGSHKQPKSVKPNLYENIVEVAFLVSEIQTNTRRNALHHHEPPAETMSLNVWVRALMLNCKIKGFNGNIDAQRSYLCCLFHEINTTQYNKIMKIFCFQNKILAASLIPSLRAHQWRH